MISVNAHAGRERHSSRYLLGVEQGVMPGSVFEAMRCLIRAPHRLFFMGGLCALVVGMLWWAPVLIMRWAGVASAYPMPAVWLHAWLMTLGIFPFFVFGFLLTALPRWVGAPPVSALFYRSMAGVLYAGYTLTVVGTLAGRDCLIAGLALTGVAWALGLVALIRCLLLARAASLLHARWSIIVAAVGCIGVLVGVGAISDDQWALFAAMPSLALWGFVGPIVFVVAHRMLPFFSEPMIANYRRYQPVWSPPLVVVLSLGHGVLAFNGHDDWLFMADLPLAFITAWHAIRWRGWAASHVPLLWSLHISFAWLPVAALLSATQSLALFAGYGAVLGLAPAHALGMGLATSMVFAMVTRVSLGHSGRQLEMDNLSVLCFLILQLAVVARLIAAVTAGNARWLFLFVAIGAWFEAILPWAIRYGRIYCRPRADGQPG
ncbi:NnrS family protein [Salinisphaera shabanensis]|uniref:NnrS family protein n=1 Tax=Salinisphaera shabanensis TaxID=180542 RepID=UPI003340D574